MVSSKTSDPKKRRYTYAERTVTAISDIRRQHPRSPIHLKTLRAQIRKNAETQNDLLGPRWQAGVNLACKHLADQGILDPEHPPGRLILTPKGKQIIAGVRHSVGLTSDHEHDEECHENLGRKVIRRLSHSPRRARRAISVISVGEDDVVRKAPSKMTRAALLQENKKLKAEYDALQRENARKVAELEAELEERDDQLLEYRDQVSMPHEDSPDIGNDDAGRREASGHDTAVPVDRTHSTGEARGGTPRQPQELLIRANTGSLISDISKQPTPAPSDAGTLSIPSSPVHGVMDVGEMNGANEGFELDFDGGMDTSFDPDVTLTETPVASRFPVARSGLQTHTPTSSPPRILRKQLGAVMTATEHQGTFSERVRLELEKKLADKDAALKAQDSKVRYLEGRVSDLSKLEEEILVLRKELETAAELRKNIGEGKDKLQKDIDRLKADLLEKTADLESVRDLLQQKDREAEAKTLEAQKVLQDADKNLRERLEKTRVGSEAVKASLQETIRDLKQELAEAREDQEAFTKKAQDKQDECEKLQVKLQVAQDQDGVLRNDLENVQAKLGKELTDRERLETELGAARERGATFDSTVNTLKNQLQDTQKELQTERESANNLHQTLLEMVAERDGLSTELEAKQTALLGAQSTLTQQEAEIAKLQEQLASTEQIATDLRASVATLENKLQNSELLAMAFEDAEEEVADLKRGYERLKRVQLAEFEQMDERVSKKRKRSSMPAFSASAAENRCVDARGESAMLA